MLGICLGMEFVGERMLEFGEHEGFGWLPRQGRASAGRRGRPARVPHMGWSVVEPSSTAARFFQGPERMRTFYFCHSYTLVTDAAACGGSASRPMRSRWSRRVLDGTVFATQFHPEKSQMNGQKLIQSFLEWSAVSEIGTWC